MISIFLMLYILTLLFFFFFFSSRRRHTRYWRDWSSDVCSSDLVTGAPVPQLAATPLDPFTGQTVDLSAAASTDPDGTIDNYDWDLDGNGTFEDRKSVV